MGPLRPVAAACCALLVLVAGAASTAADGIDPPTADAAHLDDPFHYGTGDHLIGDEEVPTTTRYGHGRPVFLVGDSMAGQLADGLLRVTGGQSRSLLPRTKSGGTFRLPGADSISGRWSERVKAQVRGEASQGRKPIVVLAGRGLGTTRQIRATVWHLRSAGAKVHLATASPLPFRRRVPADVRHHDEAT